MAEGLARTGYPHYSDLFYRTLDEFSRKYRPQLDKMIDDIRQYETGLCKGTYFTFTTEEYENLPDDCKTLSELDRILTKIHDGNYQEL